jgi:hypothetical protein
LTGRWLWEIETNFNAAENGKKWQDAMPAIEGFYWVVRELISIVIDRRARAN